ncbi:MULTISPECIES: hypothetical protein [unclassified Caballeronia]|uniref:hypothetical protein n=1 Tax=unclassified Caballeronia TaxID=2646786 RepID=UPI0028659496|nr:MULTISPECIES: hypothetical protein [unclassified Caballeronia]MDR5739507.1 hypothetical protein [Caballeronia sp. LZ016]MDR5807975.1 hypothetical protein [Caballeronia sp. LZ019]
MRSKSSGVAVVAVLVGVAVAVTLFIAGMGKSSRHADVSPAHGEAVAAQDLSASDAAFRATTMQPASGSDERTAAR